MPTPTPQMTRFFLKRTKEHIKRVSKNMDRVAKNFEFEESDFRTRKLSHDLSKFSAEERRPYIFLTWDHKCKNENIPYKCPDEIAEEIRKATYHHIHINMHHPEAHDSPSDMNALDIAEMVCDWAAMSQELDTSLKDWADKNVNKKWKFTNAQTKFIYELVHLFPELNSGEVNDGPNFRNFRKLRGIRSRNA
jgi:hypothetical protein